MASLQSTDPYNYNAINHAEVPTTSYNLSRAYTPRGIIKGIQTAVAYAITIPATVDAQAVLNQDRFAGPLYVGARLGTARLVK